MNSKKEIKLVGIISGHYENVNGIISDEAGKCGSKDGYSLFESIHPHVDWIKTTMNTNP